MKRADPEPLDAGKPWLEIDTIDLKASLQNGDTVTDAAKLLLRTEGEVCAKMRVLKLREDAIKRRPLD